MQPDRTTERKNRNEAADAVEHARQAIERPPVRQSTEAGKPNLGGESFLLVSFGRTRLEFVVQTGADNVAFGFCAPSESAIEFGVKRTTPAVGDGVEHILGCHWSITLA